MKRQKILILVFTLLLLATVGYGLYLQVLRFKAGQNKPVPLATPVLTTPASLSTNFDPTRDTAIFKILKIDPQAKMVDLEVVWPDSWQGKQFTSRLVCSEGTTKIVNMTSRKEDVVDFNTLISKATQNTKQIQFLRGLCKSTDYHRITTSS